MSPALRLLSANKWAMVPEIFASLAEIVERHDAGIRLSTEELRAAIGSDGPSQTGEAAMQIVGDTAVIPIRGVISRYADQINGICQDAGRSAESIQSDIKSAMGNLMVKRIALRIDSPGGTVAGTAETGAAIRAATAAGKPVHAFVDGMAASAAYWLASQAASITASAPTAEAGSIGVITAHVDETKRQDAKGVRVHVIRSTALKAPGAAGEALSGEQLASIQREINALHSTFTAAVASGRNMDATQIAQVSSGEMWTADQAQALGLIDGVMGWDAWLASLPSRGTRASTSKPSTQKASAMDIEALSALTNKHPTKAAEIVAQVKAGKNAEQIEAHLVNLAREDKITELTVKSNDALAALTAEKGAHEAAKTAHVAALAAKDEKIAALEKQLGIKAAHEDPGPGEGSNLSRSKMSFDEKGRFIAAHGETAYQALPF